MILKISDSCGENNVLYFMNAIIFNPPSFFPSRFSVSALRTFQSSKVPMILCQILTTSDWFHNSTELVQNTDESGQFHGSSNSGYVNELALNSSAQKLLGNILVSWKHNSNNKRDLTLIVPV